MNLPRNRQIEQLSGSVVFGLGIQRDDLIIGRMSLFLEEFSTWINNVEWTQAAALNSGTAVVTLLGMSINTNALKWMFWGSANKMETQKTFFRFLRFLNSLSFILFVCTFSMVLDKVSRGINELNPLPDRTTLLICFLSFVSMRPEPFRSLFLIFVCLYRRI